MTGTQLKDARKELGMTQEEMAERMGYKNRESIAQLEGKDEVPGYVAAHVRTLLQLPRRGE